MTDLNVSVIASDSGYSNQATVTVGIVLDSDRGIQARKADLLRLDRTAHAGVLEMTVRHAGRGILDRREPPPIRSTFWLQKAIADSRASVALTHAELPEAERSHYWAIALGLKMRDAMFKGAPEDQSIASTLLWHAINTFAWSALAKEVLLEGYDVLNTITYGGLADEILKTVDWVSLASDMEDDAEADDDWEPITRDRDLGIEANARESASIPRSPMNPETVKAMPLDEFERTFGFRPQTALEKWLFAVSGERPTALTLEAARSGLLGEPALGSVNMT